MYYVQLVLLGLIAQGLGCGAHTLPEQPRSGRTGATSATQLLEPEVVSIDKQSAQKATSPLIGRALKREQMPSQAQICNADELLLSVYDFSTIYGTPLPSVCCTDAIKLDAQWRCELDWPSSDVPTCTSLSGMADRLMRFIETRPKWYTAAHRHRALLNAGRLRSLSVSKGDCVP